MKTNITDQSEEQKKNIFAEQENVLSNVEIMLIKRGQVLDQFAKNNIISMNEKFVDAPKQIEKSTPEKSFFELIEVSKDKLNTIKLKNFQK